LDGVVDREVVEADFVFARCEEGRYSRHDGCTVVFPRQSVDVNAGGGTLALEVNSAKQER
jgi:threonine dehydratase